MINGYMKKKPSDSIRVGKYNAEILDAWIKKTPIKKVPRNQFNCANRTKILTNLGIQGSKDQTAIKEALSRLDEKLTGEPSQAKSKNTSDERVEFYRRRIANLEQQLTFSNSELAIYKRRDILVDHLINTGTILK